MSQLRLTFNASLKEIIDMASTSKADNVIRQVADGLAAAPGIDAIVLGGSRATGTATESSDIDIGIYYNESFDMAAFRALGMALDDARRPDCITDIGEWGPWINGGGWLTVDGMAVDLLLRDTGKVARCIDDCIAGKLTIDYQCGHPFGFVNSIYMGEVYLCQPLCEHTGTLAALKRRLEPYPETYRREAMAKFLWECDFSLMCGRKAASKRDVLYASGSLFRSAVALVYALYAHYRMYCLNEKGCLKRLVASGVALPDGFAATLEGACALTGDNIAQAFDAVQRMYEDVRRICAQQ